MNSRRPPEPRLLARFALAAGCALLAGCAVRYTDGAGRLHTVGVLWQTTVAGNPRAASDDAPRRFAFRLGPLHDSAALLRQRTIGVALSWTDFNRGFALGYAEQLVVLPALVEGVTTVDYDSRSPLSTLLTFDARLHHPAPPDLP